MSVVFVPYQEGAPLPPPPGAELSLEQLMGRLKELEAQKEIVRNLIKEKNQVMDPEVDSNAIPDDTEATESSESETDTISDDDADSEEASELSESETDLTSDGEDDSDEAEELDYETDTIPIKEDDADEEIPAEAVIAFVKELEEAHRFFDLKHYLREHKEFKELDYGSRNIFQFLVEKVESDNIFDNDQEAIWKAVQGHITEVRAEICRKRFTAYAEKRVQQKLRDSFGERDEYTITQHRAIYTRFPGLRYVEPPSMNLSNPVVKLVYETREKMPVYDMDEDPQVELRKIKKSDPMYYHIHFIYRQPPAKIRKNTVTISNLRPDANILHAEELLSSCGKIVQYEEERGKRKSMMIHVTFKHAEGAKTALEKEFPTIDGRPVLITTPQSAPNRFKPEDVRASNDAQCVKEALRSYNELRDKY